MCPPLHMTQGLRPSPALQEFTCWLNLYSTFVLDNHLIVWDIHIRKQNQTFLQSSFPTVTLREQVTTQKEYILCLVHQSQPVLLKLQKLLLPGGWSVFKESKAGGIFKINSVTYITTHCKKKDEQVIYLWVVDLSSSLHFHKFS